MGVGTLAWHHDDQRQADDRVRLGQLPHPHPFAHHLEWVSYIRAECKRY